MSTTNPTLVLYTRTGCGYCAVVQETLQELNLTAEEREIGNPAFAKELRERGGKQQVPYLVDENNGVEMYESEDIAEYLRTMYGDGATREA